MKIGILTYHRAHNYGAVLQAYALYNVVKSLGHDVEFIDYWPSYRDGEYDLFRFKYYLQKQLSVLHRCKLLVYRSLTITERLIRFNKFEDFIKNYLKLSDNKYYIADDFVNANYDVVICGSDQIWAHHNLLNKKGFDDLYFGKFPDDGNIRKLSYAASMGVEDIDEKALINFSENLKNFDAISVREESLLRMVHKSINGIKVLDPVFILPMENWRQMVYKPKIKEKYLLFYQLLESEEAMTLAKKIAKDKNLRIVEIRGIITPFLWAKNIECTTGPLDFISLIANAEYVISTSFHGVAFSILFNRQFTAMGFKNNGSRVTSLLNSLGIERCMIENKTNNYFDDIDYNNVNLKLAKMIEVSKNFLTTNISI